MGSSSNSSRPQPINQLNRYISQKFKLLGPATNPYTYVPMPYQQQQDAPQEPYTGRCYKIGEGENGERAAA